VNSLGITHIGYIENGNSATYTVGVPRSGAYALVFKIASNWDQGASRFNVTVNGSPAGTITGHTNDWDDYTFVALGSDVQLNAGNNTITLNFQSPINVDYFLVLGEPGQTLSVRQSADRASGPAVSRAALRASAKGFAALLPANHAYTSYKLIDLQGREIKRGVVSPSTAEIHFGDLKTGVIFLRLEGKNGVKTVLRATAF
jgi:hypothetical protein